MVGCDGLNRLVSFPQRPVIYERIMAEHSVPWQLQMTVRSNEQLDGLVADAQRIVSGVEPQRLRDSSVLRQHVATELSRVQSVLDGLLVDRPRRNILRRPK